MLLAKGYFPKELPPCFSAESFASWAKPRRIVPSSGEQSYRSVTHSLARAGGVRRTLSVPHPEPYLRLCKEIGSGWKEIGALLDRSDLSQSSPVLGNEQGRAFLPKLPLGDLSAVRIKHRRHARYVLVGDVAEFYRSVYTHSVPWALHSKEVGKQRRRDLTLLGNRLDNAIMAGQDGQTNGIPVGPDASLVIGELLLSAVDVELRARLGADARGFRYYDDYEFSFARRGEAEAALQHFQEVLADYSLHLNPLKTRVVELPQRLESSWLTEFRDFRFAPKTHYSLQRIIRFFDRAFELHAEHRDSYVLPYAISRVAGADWRGTAHWPTVQDLLMQAVTVEMSAAQQFVTVLIEAKQREYELDNQAIQRTLNYVITESAPSGYASETTWALWGLLSLRLKIDGEAARALERSQDVFVALLALDANHQGLVDGGLEVSAWESVLAADELHGERWLLAYEAPRRGWLGGRGPHQHIKENQFFHALNSAGVSFYSPVTGAPLSADALKRLKKRPAQSYSTGSEDEKDESDEQEEDEQDESDEEEEDERDESDEEEYERDESDEEEYERDESDEEEYERDESDEEEYERDESDEGEYERDESDEGEYERDESDEEEYERDESDEGEYERDESDEGEYERDESDEGEYERDESDEEDKGR
nr:RNA-directed DNA polymerase [Myxococcus sp. AB036A]